MSHNLPLPDCPTSVELLPVHGFFVQVQSFTRVVSSASIIENSEVPVVLYPLILAAQSVHVSTPGMEPEVAAGVDHEDASLLMSQGDWDPASGLPSDTERKAFFSKTANRKVCSNRSHHSSAAEIF